MKLYTSVPVKDTELIRHPGRTGRAFHPLPTRIFLKSSMVGSLLTAWVLSLSQIETLQSEKITKLVKNTRPEDRKGEHWGRRETLLIRKTGHRCLDLQK